MISILTCVVVMVAMGTVLQRADSISGLLDWSSSGVDLKDDKATAPINSLLRVDVLANDEGVSLENGDELQLVGLPACGHVFVRSGAIEYVPAETCTGVQEIRYGVKGQNTYATLSATVVPPMEFAASDEPEQTQVAAANPAPASPASAATTNATPTTGTQATPAPTAAVPSDDASDDADLNDDAYVADDTDDAATGSAEASVALVVADAPAPQPGAALQLSAATGTDDASLTIARSSETPVAVLNSQRAAASVLSGAGNVGASPSASIVSQNDTRVKAGASGVPALSPTTATGTSDGGSEVVLAAVEPTRVRSAPAQRLVAPGSAQPAPRKVEQFETEAEVFADLLSDVDTVAGNLAPAPRGPLFRETGDVEIAARQVTDGSASFVTGKAQVLGVGQAGARTDASNVGGLWSIVGLGGSSDDTETGFMVAVIDRGSASVDLPGVPQHGLLGSQKSPAGADTGKTVVARADEITIAALSPSLGLNTPISQGGALAVEPVDASQGPYVAPAAEEPTVERSNDIKVAALPVEGEPKDLGAAASPSATANCVVPPSVSMLPKRAAQTTLNITAPCHGSSVAEITYSKLRLAVALDSDGKGEITLPGFDAQTRATIGFLNGEVIDVDLQFRDVQRISRVALVWDKPVDIELNAMEFGATFGGSDHIRPENPRDYRDVRKTGGGFLTEHESILGVGQNAQVYTHFHRPGGKVGAVKMMIDFASRNRDRLAEACGEGAHAAPMFQVLRMDRGGSQRRSLRQLAPVACSEAGSADPSQALISGAVEDLLITQR